MKIKLILAGLFVAMTLSAADKSAEEKQFEKWMKDIGGSMGGFKKGYEAKDAAAVAKAAESAQKAFAESAGFWKKHNLEKPEQLSKDAAKAAAETLAAAKAGDLEKAKASFGGVGKTCKPCHEAHREDLGDHKYAIKY